MTDNQNNRRKGKGFSMGVVIFILAAVIANADSCDCSNDFLSEISDKTNDRPLANFDYEINLDDYDFSIFDDSDDDDFSSVFEEDPICLRVKQASFDQTEGVITAVIENYGNKSEDGNPAITAKYSKGQEDYICCVYPDSYYEDVSDEIGYSIDYRTLILPKTEVTLSYQVQSYELRYLNEAIEETGGEVWVTFYKDTAEETYCLLEIE